MAHDDDSVGGRTTSGGELKALLRNPRFELIPLDNALGQAEHLPHGSRVAVTASPTNGQEATVELSGVLARQGFDVAAHIAARLVRDRAHLRDVVDSLTDSRVRQAFVIAGDGAALGGYDDSLALLADLETFDHGLTSIGIAGYPEGHPKIRDRYLMQALLSKQSVASYITTQMCFNPEATRAWISTVRASGVSLPVHVGIPGVARLSRLISISAKIGVGPSVRFLRKADGLTGRLANPLGYTPDKLLAGLTKPHRDSRPAIAGLHLYTFNDVETTEKWRSRLLMRLDDEATELRDNLH